MVILDCTSLFADAQQGFQNLLPLRFCEIPIFPDCAPPQPAGTRISLLSMGRSPRPVATYHALLVFLQAGPCIVAEHFIVRGNPDMNWAHESVQIKRDGALAFAKLFPHSRLFCGFLFWYLAPLQSRSLLTVRLAPIFSERLAKLLFLHVRLEPAKNNFYRSRLIV